MSDKNVYFEFTLFTIFPLLFDCMIVLNQTTLKNLTLPQLINSCQFYTLKQFPSRKKSVTLILNRRPMLYTLAPIFKHVDKNGLPSWAEQVNSFFTEFIAFPWCYCICVTRKNSFFTCLTFSFSRAFEQFFVFVLFFVFLLFFLMILE